MATLDPVLLSTAELKARTNNMNHRPQNISWWDQRRHHHHLSRALILWSEPRGVLSYQCYNDIIQITVLGHFTHLGRSDTNVWQIGVIINDNDLFKSKKTEGNQNSNPFFPSDRALILHTFLWKGTHFNWARLKRKLKKIIIIMNIVLHIGG